MCILDGYPLNNSKAVNYDQTMPLWHLALVLNYYGQMIAQTIYEQCMLKFIAARDWAATLSPNEEFYYANDAKTNGDILVIYVSL